MEFLITTKGSAEVVLFQELPDNLKSYSIAGANCIYAQGEFGNMIFQNIEGKGFKIWHSNYLMVSDTSFTGRAEYAVLELHFSFFKHTEYFLEGIGKTSLSEGQFNITYTPFINNKSSLFGGKNYHTFDIHFEIPFLQKFALGSTELSIFLDSIDKGNPGNITPEPHFATPEMKGIINRILNSPYHGALGEFFIQSQVILLLLDVLAKIAKDKINKGTIKLSASDKESIYAAKDYLILHMDNPPSIIQLARTVGINDYKLKKGFKQVFNTTTFNYLEIYRLNKALIMVKETTMPIAEIGYTLGFAYPTYFTAVFKKKFGFPPSHFRK